ncbi:hypothetical protein FB566_4395 [Stackebrandtia endophytica]|uniref:Uncharacterized protein n=1 Tax=Stackebrandtia endophytica TaxID=1496996 RepID=A0A543B1V1_9ACTN|nr:hypothetical protein [Stackebrandtia endophytica]TQL78801.1 hypothetical protein FB566_4395 [Stackebrandtia endophytica]
MNNPPTVNRLALAGATVTSGIAAILGIVWLIRPDWGFFYSNPDLFIMVGLAGTTAATALHTGTAVLGVIAGAAALSGRLGSRGIVLTGSAQLIVFGIALGSMATLSVAGYLVAMSMPIVIVVLLVQLVRRYPVARWVVGVPLLAAAVIGIVLGWSTLGKVVSNLGTGLAASAGQLGVVLLVLLLGFSWTIAVVSATRGSAGAARATAWVTRHRKVIAVIAALGPMPYALVRLTWLTPWPWDVSADMLTMDVRIWGLTLSSGAWLGFVLTLGLIRPWGTVWPRWVPRFAGRPVPVAAAVVPGAVIAAVVCFAAVPMLYNASSRGFVAMLEWALVFPCWFWGPALALAVWGYAGYRRELAARESSTGVHAGV